MIARRTLSSDFCDLGRDTQFIVLAKLEGLSNREIAVLLDRLESDIDADLARVISDWKTATALRPEELPPVDPASVSEDDIRKALESRAKPGRRYTLVEAFRYLASLKDAK